MVLSFFCYGNTFFSAYFCLASSLWQFFFSAFLRTSSSLTVCFVSFPKKRGYNISLFAFSSPLANFARPFVASRPIKRPLPLSVFYSALFLSHYVVCALAFCGFFAGFDVLLLFLMCAFAGSSSCFFFLLSFLFCMCLIAICNLRFGFWIRSSESGQSLWNNVAQAWVLRLRPMVAPNGFWLVWLQRRWRREWLVLSTAIVWGCMHLFFHPIPIYIVVTWPHRPKSVCVKQI